MAEGEMVSFEARRLSDAARRSLSRMNIETIITQTSRIIFSYCLLYKILLVQAQQDQQQRIVRGE